jgi:hypothetical protein
MLAAQKHIREVLGPALEREIRRRLPSTARWTLEPDADDPDAQTLLFHYPSAMGTTAYVRPVDVAVLSDAEEDLLPPRVVWVSAAPGRGAAARGVTPEWRAVRPLPR